MSFDLFAYKELKDVVSDCEDRYHHIESSEREADYVTRCPECGEIIDVTGGCYTCRSCGFSKCE